MNAVTVTPAPIPVAISGPSSTRLALGLGGLVLGLGGLAGLTFLSVMMMAFAFDSPYRKTSPDLVFGLAMPGLGGLAAAIVLFGFGQIFHPRRWAKAMWILGIVVFVIALGLYGAGMGFAFFGG